MSDVTKDITTVKVGTASFGAFGTNKWMAAPDHADWALGFGDFTIDFWNPL